MNVSGTANFSCDYTGTREVPLWYIGGIQYSTFDLPRRCTYRNRILTVTNVQMSDNGKTFQCAFVFPRSQVAILTVLDPRGKSNYVFAHSTVFHTRGELVSWGGGAQFNGLI